MSQTHLAIAFAMLSVGALSVPFPAIAKQTTAAEHATPARFQKARATIQQLIKDEHVPSVTVAVAHDGNIIWQEGFGWANRERRVPATPQTPYSIASITKSITSTGIMTLAGGGELDLDAPIERYLGQLKLHGYAGPTEGVTARRIMAHSGGLPTYFYFYHAGYPPAPAEETMSRYGMVVFPPNAVFNYSNIGYRALDLAASRISGMSYAEFLRREVFIPLGMNRSELGQSPVWKAEAALRYDLKNNPIPFYMTDTPGSGDVWSSAHDLLRFGMFHVDSLLPGQQRILAPEAVALMQLRASAPESATDWGLGWSLETWRGYRVVRHGGNQPGVHSQLVLLPDEKLVIVVLSNQNHSNFDIWKEIASAVLPVPARASTDSGSGAEALPPLQLSGRWAGTVTTYESTEDFELIFQPDGDIHVKVGPRMPGLVNFVENNGHTIEGRSYVVMNTKDALRHRHTLVFKLMLDGDELVGQLVAEAAGDPATFALPGFVRLKQQR